MKKSVQKNQSPNSSLTYLKYFFLALFILILGAISYKAVRLGQQSTFTTHYYTVLVLGKNPFLINIDTVKKRILTLELDYSLVRDIRMPEEATYRLMLPVNAIINFKSEDASRDYTSKSFFTESSFFSHVSRINKYDYININQFDVGKVYFLGKYSAFSMDSRSVSKIYDKDELVLGYEKYLEERMRDQEVLNEKISVEVVNASGVNGLGSKISKILTMNGFNVVSVSSATEPIPGSTIITRIVPNITTSRVEQIFSIPHVYKQENYLADISIVIGEDFANKKLKAK